MVYDPERDGPRVVHLVHKDGTAEAVDHPERVSVALYGEGARFADDTLTYPAAIAYLHDVELPVIEHDVEELDDDEVTATEPHHHEPAQSARTVQLDDDAAGADE